MTHYILTLSADKKVIGSSYPQITNISDSSDLKNKLEQIDNSIFLPTSNNKLDYFILKTSAKITDTISTNVINSNDGILISDRFKNLLEDNFQLCSHSYYPATVMYKNKVYTNYFFLHLRPYFNQKHVVEYADLPSSIFYVGDIIGTKKYEITFKTIEEIQEARKIVFQKNSDRVFNGYYVFNNQLANLDLFVIHFCDFNLYISERLKNKLDTEQISGLTIINTNKIVIKSSI